MRKTVPMYALLVTALALLLQAPLSAATPAAYRDAPTTIEKWQQNDPCDQATCANMPPSKTINVGQLASQIKICVWVYIDIDIYVSAYVSPPGLWVRVHQHVRIYTYTCIDVHGTLILRDAAMNGDDNSFLERLDSATFSGLTTGSDLAGPANAGATVLDFVARDRAGNELSRYLASS